MSRPRTLFIGLSASAAAMVALTAAGAYQMFLREHRPIGWILMAETLVYGAAAGLLLRRERNISGELQRRCVMAILGVALVLRVMLVFQTPMSTDVYRYIWDGRVQGAGTNPYRYPPADPHLASLRDNLIYPEINHAQTATTIYPPTAQMIFFAATHLTEDVRVMKTIMVACEFVGIAALLALLAQRELPMTRIVLYAWHPLPLFEFAGSGHIDAAAIGFMLLACFMADRRYPAVAGALLAGAALVKYFPVVIAPALHRRWDWRLPAAALVTGVLLYLPYIGVGRRVVGFLPGYADEEGLTGGSGFFPLALLQQVLLLPSYAPLAYIAIAAALMVVLSLYVIFRPAPAKIALGGATLLVTTFTVLISPHYPWYFTWIVPFLCFRPSAALIYLTGSASLLHGLIWTPGRLTLNVAIYGPFVLLLIVEIFRSPERSIHPLNDGGRFDQSRAA